MPERKTFLLRVGADLWTEIERMAADEFRSVNAQVEFLLRDAVRRRGRAVEPGKVDSGASPGDVANEA